MRPFMISAGAALTLMALAACEPQDELSGRADFRDYCAGCHGADATGGGPVARALGLQTPDLTLIARREGGAFPFTRVMSVIDGYTRKDQHGSKMPEFGPLLDGPKVMLEYENGAVTPTPAALVALARYLESIQR